MNNTTPPNPLVRLDALPQRARRLHVDRSYPGRIRGASLITTGPAAGHGFVVDRATVEQVARNAEGLRGRWTHGELSADGLGRHLGRWERVYVEPFLLCRTCQAEVTQQTCPTCQGGAALEHRAVGDFLFDRSAHKLRPDGLHVPAPIYLLDRAEEDPQSLGISVVARFGFEEVPPESEAEEPARVARLASRRDLLRGDWVADPAANPIGLSADLHTGTNTPSELTEGAVAALDRIVARVGTQQAKTRALAFLARYFGDTFGEEVVTEVAPESGLGALRAQVNALSQELSALRETVTRYQALDRARELEEQQTLLIGLKAEAAALNAPIPAADLDKVQALLDAGDTETATILGEAFLGRAQALAQKPFSRQEHVPLDPAAQPAGSATKDRILSNHLERGPAPAAPRGGAQ